MKLWAKILGQTLGLTAGLAGAVALSVRADLTEHETTRARRDIAAEVNSTVEMLRREQAEVERLVGLLMGEPQNRAILEAIAAVDDEAREFALSQLRDEVFGRVVQTELTRGRMAPSFHILLDDRGRFLMASAPGDQALANALVSRDHHWPWEALLAGRGEVRGFVWADGALYRTLGVGLRLEAEGDPTHAYFVGYRVTDDLLRDWLGHGPDLADASVRAWLVYDGNVIARSGAPGDLREADDTTSGDTPARALARLSMAMHPTGQRERIEFRASGERFLGEALFFEPEPGKVAAFAVACSLDEALAGLRGIQTTIGLIAIAAMGVAALGCVRLARKIARPVERLAVGTEAIARGEFGVKVEAKGNDEMASLARSFNHMAAGLEQRDLIKDTFGKFVDPKVVERILADPSRLKLGGEVRVQSVLFADLEGFTTLAERMRPEELVRLLNEYLGMVADEVAALNGIVDKFIGDAVVAFWGPPLTEDHAARACAAALRIAEIAAGMADTCAAMGCAPLRARVGVATGEALVGNIGSRSKFNYTVMGDVVNLGSRLEGLNKFYATTALATAETASAAGAGATTRRIDIARVVGRSEPVELHEILAAPQAPGAREAFEGAMRLYAQGRWAEAAAAFEGVARENPNDGPAQALARRCREFEASGPPAGWDGVWSHDSK